MLEIFPDADMDCMRMKLKEENNNVLEVVAILSENGECPRQPKESADGLHGLVIRRTKEPKDDCSST